MQECILDCMYGVVTSVVHRFVQPINVRRNMIDLFFNRFSKVVILMEMAGLTLIIAGIALVSLKDLSPCFAVFLILIATEYAFIRYCASVRWYGDSARWSGIELQLKKAMVPTSYILAILGGCLLITRSIIPLITAFILLAIIAHVNVILLYLRHMDKDSTPVNYFSMRHSK